MKDEERPGWIQERSDDFIVTPDEPAAAPPKEWVVENSPPGPIPVAAPQPLPAPRPKWPLWVGLGAGGVVMLFVLLAIFAAMVGPSPPDLDELYDELAVASSRLEAASTALGDGNDPAQAEADARGAAAAILRAQEAVRKQGTAISAVDRYVIQDVLAMYMAMSEAYEDMARISQEVNELSREVDRLSSESFDAIFALYPAYEVLADAFDGNALLWERVANDMERLRARPEAARYVDLEAVDASSYRETADGFREGAREIRALIDEAEGDGYEPIDDREFPVFDDTIDPNEEDFVTPTPSPRPTTNPGPPVHPTSPYFTPRVRALFDKFDADASGTIDLGEASDFFFWVEGNIRYRYDDENYADPNPGSPVGDGRVTPPSHRDYHQKPDETLAEGMGDCEDMSALEVAFYNYWSITAYEAYVNAVAETSVDHSVALIYVGETASQAASVIGRLDSRAIPAGNEWNIPAGTYMFVDNAYSGSFGYIDGRGIEPGKFQIFQVKRLGEGFTVPVN